MKKADRSRPVDPAGGTVINAVLPVI